MIRFAFSGGHGSSSRYNGKVDPGACSKWGKEYIVARFFASNMAQNMAALGYASAFIDGGLYSLADNKAKKFDADIFIEYHLNAGPIGSTGTETLVNKVYTAKEMNLAKRLSEATHASLGVKNRGVKPVIDIAVLRQYKDMESVLHELFFISNRTDYDKWLVNQGRAELAHVNALLAYLGRKPIKSLPRKWGVAKARFVRFFRKL